MRNLTGRAFLLVAVIAMSAIANEPARATDRTETDPPPGGLVGGGRVLLDCSFDVETVYSTPRVASVRGGMARKLPGSGKYSRPLEIGRFWALVEQDCPLAEPDCPTNGQTIQRNIRLASGTSALIPLAKRMRLPGYFPKISVQNLNVRRKGVRDGFPHRLPTSVNRWTAIAYNAKAAITIEPSRSKPNSYLDSNLVLWSDGGKSHVFAKAKSAVNIQLGSGRVTWISTNWLSRMTEPRSETLHSFAFNKKSARGTGTWTLPRCDLLVMICSSTTPVRKGVAVRSLDESEGSSPTEFKVSIVALPTLSRGRLKDRDLGWFR